jgi:hypothetical protein
MSEELREGLAQAFEAASIHTSLEAADLAIAYIRQHDGHAEFVRKVREIAATVPRFYESARSAQIIALCDAELAKEQPK